MAKTAKLPKTKCCVSKSRCERCPIRMLKEGSLPSGYAVKKRELVRIDGTKKVRKADLQAAIKRQRKSKKKKLAA